MEAPQIIRRFEELGYKLTPTNGNIKYELVEGTPKPDKIDPLIEELKQNKQEVMKKINLSNKSDISDTGKSLNNDSENNKSFLSDISDTGKDLNMEKILFSLTDKVDKVQLEGKEYDASNLLQMIIDFPCKIVWYRDKGFRIEDNGWEDWDWFRNTFLKPNTEQIKQLFKLAHDRYLKAIKQMEKRVKGADSSASDKTQDTLSLH